MTAALPVRHSRRRDVYETAGQHLVAYLRLYHVPQGPWSETARALLATGRGSEWAEAIQTMAVLHLTRRLIAAGAYIVSSQSEWDFIVDRELKQMILETMTIDYTEVNQIHSRLVPAIKAARSQISPGTHRQLESESQRTRAWCYLCGSDLEFGEAGTYAAFTLDHVWPRAYGGNSDDENLLPACRSCNMRKSETPSWALYTVQALVAGYRLDSQALALIPKEMRFAVQAKLAMTIAEQQDLSLKDSFMKLGRPDVPTVLEPSTSVDVFNLEHRSR